MVIKKNNVYLFLILTLIVLIPWEYFSPGRFEDLSVYKNYLYSNIRHDETLFNAPIIFLFKEVVFQQWLFFIYDFGLDIETVIFIVASITLFIFFLAIKRLQLDYRVSLLLLCPLVIDFFNAQLRNSLAFSIFLLGYSFKKRIYRFTLFTIAVTFHLGILLLIAAYFVIQFLHKYIGNHKFRIFVLIVFTFGCAFADKLFFILIDDPRIDVYGNNSGMSIIYLVWALALLYTIFVLEIKQLGDSAELDFAFIGSLLVVLSYFSGAYYGRYLAMFYPFILIAIGKFSITKPVYLLVLFYSAYTFTMNFIF